jgi:hypothetical protein
MDAITQLINVLTFISLLLIIAANFIGGLKFYIRFCNEFTVLKQKQLIVESELKIIREKLQSLEKFLRGNHGSE